MGPTFSGHLQDCTITAYLLYYSIYCFFAQVLSTIFIERNPAGLLDIQAVRDKAFSKCWESLSPPTTGTIDDMPPLEGSQALIPPLLATATGTVLDIGPGTGSFTPYFTSPDIKVIYGAEPILEFHKALKRSAEGANLQDKYIPLHCGAEPESLIPALAKARLLKGNSGMDIFDTIVCFRVLCSVPHPEETMETLYHLLKPGGKLIIREHVKNAYGAGGGSFFGRLMQIVFTALGWTIFMGNCRLSQDTVAILKSVGEWESVDLQTPMDWSVVPFTLGTFVKSMTAVE